MTSVPTQPCPQESCAPLSQRTSSSFLMIGQTPAGVRAIAPVKNDEKKESSRDASRLTQGKVLIKRLLPTKRIDEKTAFASSLKFPNLQEQPSESNEHQSLFKLAPSSSNDDIAREALRLTRETLHGPVDGRAIVVTPSTVQPHRDSTSSEGESVTTSPTQLGDLTQRSSLRLNKFVRRLHEMLLHETESGIVEWRRGLLVLKDTSGFAKTTLPKYFNTKNFKTFRRQLNYYGFVHIRSFSNNGNSTTALWVNGELAKSSSAAGTDPDDVSSVLLLRRSEPCDQAKTAELRRARKELAIRTIEEDFGVSAKTLQLQQLGNLRSIAKDGKHKIVEVRPQPMDVDPQPTFSNTTHQLVFPVESVNYNNVKVTAPLPPAVVENKPAPLSSNMSAANLLLLLSKA